MAPFCYGDVTNLQDSSNSLCKVSHLMKLSKFLNDFIISISNIKSSMDTIRESRLENELSHQVLGVSIGFNKLIKLLKFSLYKIMMNYFFCCLFQGYDKINFKFEGVIRKIGDIPPRTSMFSIPVKFNGTIFKSYDHAVPWHYCFQDNVSSIFTMLKILNINKIWIIWWIIFHKHISWLKVRSQLSFNLLKLISQEAVVFGIVESICRWVNFTKYFLPALNTIIHLSKSNHCKPTIIVNQLYPIRSCRWHICCSKLLEAPHRWKFASFSAYSSQTGTIRSYSGQDSMEKRVKKF